MARFDTSQIAVQLTQPWQWTTAPTYNPDGSILTAGVASAPLDGVFILMSPALVAWLKTTLTAAQQTALQSYVTTYTEAQLAQWHIPGWAGTSGATYVRVPAGTWNDPTTAPPAAVKTLVQSLYK